MGIYYLKTGGKNMAESLSRINNYVTKDSLKVRKEAAGTINFTKNIRLNKIKEQIPDGVKIYFNDLNKDGYIDEGETFSYIDGDKEITYYSIAFGDCFSKLKNELKITSENIKDCPNHINGEFKLIEGNFLKIVKPVQKPVQNAENSQQAKPQKDLPVLFYEKLQLAEEKFKKHKVKFSNGIGSGIPNEYIVLTYQAPIKRGFFSSGLTLGEIKKTLGIKDGVLKKYNNLDYLYQGSCPNLDAIELSPGERLLIPVKETNIEKK